jgi:glycerophosphoryl diester phosphodiesterase
LTGVSPAKGIGPGDVCEEVPEPQRWVDAVTPDEGLEDFRITVHRGATRHAPENTIPAFEYAIAYGLDMIEVDVQQTLDGRYVVFHDYDLKNRTGQDGLVQLMTYDEVKSINTVGDEGDPWKGSAYDPSYMPDLEEVLALASKHGVGISFDLKESVYNTANVALLAAEYPGVIERSIFQPYVPGRAEQIVAAVPDAQILVTPYWSTLAVSPASYYAAGAEYDWFGSDLDWFPAEAVVAIHDACDFVQPVVYSDDQVKERAGLEAALAVGADGAMVNHPEVAADVLNEPVETSIAVGGSQACLVGFHDLGLPGKRLTVDDTTATSGVGGCVEVPAGWSSIVFAGDGSAQPSSVTAEGPAEKVATVLELEVRGRGQSKTLWARLSELDSGAGVSGRAIDFYSDGELMGTVRTDAEGVAELGVGSSHRGANRHYTAVFLGDESYEAATAEAS